MVAFALTRLGDLTSIGPHPKMMSFSVALWNISGNP